MAVAETHPPRTLRTARTREAAARGAQLFAVSGFALAQPLFDVLGRNAEFFAVRGSTPSEILLFALVVTFGPALVLFAVELAVGAINRSAALALHLVFLGGLGALFAVQVLKRSGLDRTTVLIAGSVLAGITIATAVRQTRVARSFLAVLAAAPIVFLGVFLLGTPVEELVFPGGQSALADVRSSTPVVFLLFDEFPVIDLQDRRGEIDAGRFPNFARLARSSVWFRNTTTLSASTTTAVPVILTGKAPEQGALPTAHDHPNNLFTLLGRNYRMAVIESETQLCPSRLCRRESSQTNGSLSSLYSDTKVVYLHLLAPPSLEGRLPPIDESWGDFGATSTADASGLGPFSRRVRDFNRFIASFRAAGSGRPALYFLHVLLPHASWLYLPDGRVRAMARTYSPGRTGERWTNGDLAVQARQRHLLQLAFADRLLGRFIGRLQDTGLWDSALVIVTADHGISFRDGDLRRHPTATNLADLAFTPLFFKLPGRHGGRVVERHVTTPDILPTIAAVLGVNVPWSTDGASALDGRAGSRTVSVENVSASYRTTLAQRRASLARQVKLFGSGTWGPRFYRTGTYGSLIGRPVGTLRVGGQVAGEVTVDAVGSRLLRGLPEASRSIPSPLDGTASRLRGGATVAFALNGSIAGVTHVYRDPGGGPLRFSALVPESAFRPGRNALRAFVVGGPQARPRLREVAASLSR
jgi:Sulfatase